MRQVTSDHEVESEAEFFSDTGSFIMSYVTVDHDVDHEVENDQVGLLLLHNPTSLSIWINLAVG